MYGIVLTIIMMGVTYPALHMAMEDGSRLANGDSIANPPGGHRNGNNRAGVCGSTFLGD